MQKTKTYAIINVRRTSDGVNDKTNMLTCAYADKKIIRGGIAIAVGRRA